MSMRTRGTSTRAPPPPPASSRRAAGCGNEPMSKFLPRTTGIRKVTRKLKRFLRKWSLNANGAALRLLAVRFASRRCPLASFSCAYKREVAPLRETHQNFSFLSPPVPISELLLSFSSRLAACTTGRDSRPQKPHLFESCMGEG